MRWLLLIGALGVAACGSDKPAFISVLLPGDTYDTVGPYRIEAEVLAPNGVDRLLLRLLSGSGDSAYSDLPFSAIDAERTGGRFYVELPGRPAGTLFEFYLLLVDGQRTGGSKIVKYPADAPDTVASFSVLAP